MQMVIRHRVAMPPTISPWALRVVSGTIVPCRTLSCQLLTERELILSLRAKILKM